MKGDLDLFDRYHRFPLESGSFTPGSRISKSARYLDNTRFVYFRGPR